MDSIKEVVQFDLYLAKAGAGYTARAEARTASGQRSSVKASPLRFAPLKMLGKSTLENVFADRPDDPKDTAFVQALRQLGAQLPTPAPQIIDTIGVALYEALPLPVRDLYNKAWGWVMWAGAVEQRHRLLRVQLHFDDDVLGKLPWEYMKVDDRFLCQDLRRSLIRAPDDQEPSPLYPGTWGQTKILVWASTPEGMPTIDFEQELADIQEALQTLPDAEVVLFRNRPLLDLRKELTKDYNILHYVGHGEFVPEQGGVLALEEAPGAAPTLVFSHQVEAMLKDNPQYRLVFLNACRTGTSDAHNMYNSMAAVLARWVPVVVAMQYAVPTDSAGLFAREFYGALAQGLLLDQCVNQGREMLVTNFPVKNMDWGIPAIFSRAELAVASASVMEGGVLAPPAGPPPPAPGPAPPGNG